MNKTTYIILLFIFGGLLSLWAGFVNLKLWGWFLTPAFGVPVPSLAIMIGLALFVGAFKSIPDAKEDIDYEKEFINIVTKGIVGPAIFLLMGFIVSWFV